MKVKTAATMVVKTVDWKDSLLVSKKVAQTKPWSDWMTVRGLEYEWAAR
jgi:hypothetical protein